MWGNCAEAWLSMMLRKWKYSRIKSWRLNLSERWTKEKIQEVWQRNSCSNKTQSTSTFPPMLRGESAVPSTVWENTHSAVLQSAVFTVGRWDPLRSSEVTEDTDVCKLFAVAVSTHSEYEGPLQAQEAPNAGQVEAPRVSQGCGREILRLALRSCIFFITTQLCNAIFKYNTYTSEASRLKVQTSVVFC